MIALAIVTLLLVSILIYQKKKYSTFVKSLQEEIVLAKQETFAAVINFEECKMHSSHLQKYTVILDLEREVKRLDDVKSGLSFEIELVRKKSEETSVSVIQKANQEAEVHIQKIKEECRQKLKETDLIVSKIITEAILNEKELRTKNERLEKEMTAYQKQVKEDADLLIESSKMKSEEQSRKILEEAELKAKSIAGEALDAMRKVNELDKTAKALKNVIEGYGDKYIVPTFSLLDSLADQYSHTDAGLDLKKSREKMRSMVKNKEAADCDYVEVNRKETAIDFVMDAFNGKVDSIMASVKEDNIGTLSQKLKDAFYTVNANGEAFRNARITEKYLKLRLEELKLACTVQALKERDREEQRRIKEQLREEEKAAREYEKALKEAQKDQETVNRAIEKIMKDMELASEAKRIEYEEKLKGLQTKLLEAEEKNKRAQSMAELTKSGHVYIISNIGSFGDDVLKIGMTRRLDPMDRIYELGDASVPFDFDVHAMVYSEDAPALERELHRIFALSQINKVNPRKEFFKLNIAEIKSALDKKGLNVQWTMIADAREYRESLSLEGKKVA